MYGLDLAIFCQFVRLANLNFFIRFYFCFCCWCFCSTCRSICSCARCYCRCCWCFCSTGSICSCARCYCRCCCCICSTYVTCKRLCFWVIGILSAADAGLSVMLWAVEDSVFSPPPDFAISALIVCRPSLSVYCVNRSPFGNLVQL